MTPDKEPRFDEIAAEILGRLERGEEIDPAEYERRHPSLTARLQEFFSVESLLRPSPPAALDLDPERDGDDLAVACAVGAQRRPHRLHAGGMEEVDGAFRCAPLAAPLLFAPPGPPGRGFDSRVLHHSTPVEPLSAGNSSAGARPDCRRHKRLWAIVMRPTRCCGLGMTFGTSRPSERPKTPPSLSPSPNLRDHKDLVPKMRDED